MSDILSAYTHTPIEWLLRHHNLSEPLPSTSGWAELLVGMCMDDRKDLVMPNEFAFVIRAAGGNLRDHEFAYPAVLVAPLLYRVEDDRLLQIVH